MAARTAQPVFLFRSFEPLKEEQGAGACTFQIPYNPPMTPAGLQKLLSGFSEVQLMRAAE
jgi:hypothetical protein